MAHRSVRVAELTAFHVRIPLRRVVRHASHARTDSDNLLVRYDDLTALSLDLGFSSHSHFSAAFREAYGRSPSAFRRLTASR